MQHHRKDQRELEAITETEKIYHLIQKYLLNQTMYLRGFDPPYQVKIAGADKQNILSVNMGQYEPEEGQQITMFRILGRYMHLKCRVVKYTGQGNLYTVTVEQAAIARANRSALRLPIRHNEAHISNIRASKHTIDATLFNIPTSVKVNFSTYEQNLKGRFEFVKIDVFGKRGTVLDEIRKTGRTLFIRDTQNPDDYKARDDGFVDYAEYLDDDLRSSMIEYQRGKIKSDIIVPVNYITHDQSSIPLGYIQAQSKTEHLDVDKVLELREIAFEMVDRIRDSNTVLIQEQQPILNVSNGGLKVLITNQELREYLARQNGFTFDLFFKMQAPITLYGLIRSAYTGVDGLTLGLQISGNSSRPGEIKRFKDNIANLERQLKETMQKKG
ncbi:MAG: DUF1577 domain-containing protein [Leptospiraceae bacterium]|nr:DUF1577 domain-containing protein [Leptospiraceae bacterium]MCB1321014.1 DUF1577 domain-containing protein [Leptospiraceae bacterium]